MATIKGIKVGTTTITASYTDGGVTQTSTVDFEVVKAAGSVTTAPTASNPVYGSGNYLCTAGSGTGTMYYRVGTTGSFSTTRPTTSGLNAGTYTVYYYAAESDSYNQSATGSITVTIGQKEVGLTWGTTSWIYDGSTHSTTCTATGLVGSDTCTVTLTGNSVGPAKNTTGVTVTASSLSNANYKLPSSKTTTIKINARPVRYVATDQSKAYDGSKLNANNTASLTAGTYSGTTYYELVSGHTATITGSGSTSAATAGSTGTKTISVVIKSGSTDVSSNYAITTVNGTLTITKASGSVTTAPTNAAVTYGSGNNLCSAGAGTGTMQYKLDSGSWSSTIPTATTSVSAGNHTLYYRAAESTNYNQSSESSITVTVAKKSVTLTWGTLTWTYDGSAHTTTCSIASGVISGTTCTVSLSGNSVGKNVGTATVTASLSNNNYTISGDTSKTLSITQKEVTLTWGTTSWVYDGSAHSTTCTVKSSSLVSGDTCTVTLTGNSVGKNVGSATVTASSLSNSNYKLPSSKTKTISITAKVATLTWGTTTWVYDGNTHSTTCTVNNLVGTDTCTVTLTGNSVGANVGTATVQATALSNSNYTLTGTTSDTSKTLSITQADGSGSVTMTGWTYGGTVTNPTPSSSTNGTGSVTYTWYNSSKTQLSSKPGSTSAAGTYYVKATFAATTNYKAYTTDYVSFTIAQKEVELVWGTTSWTYDGSAHSTTCTVKSSSLVGSDTCTVTLSNNSVGAAVGTQTVTASSLSNSNYKLPSSKTKTISITQRSVTYTATDQSKPYDGSKLNADNSATLTSGSLVSGHTATITGSGSTSAATAGSTGTKTISVVIKSGSTNVSSNYNISTVNGTLTITKATGSVTTAPTNSAVTYGSGSNLCSAGSGTGTMQYKLDSGSWSSTIPTATTSVSAGNHTLYYRAAESTNYEQSAESSITVTVAQKGVTVTWGTLTWPYDGSAHSTTCTISSGVISGTTCDVTLSNNSVGKNVGSKTVTASLSNSNYTISSGGSSKTISITAKVVTLTWGTLTWTYDNSTHSTTCTVNNLVGTDTCTVTLTGNSVGAAVGTSTVTASELSNGNYTLTGASNTSKTLSVTQREVTLTWGDTTWVYDGSAHSTTCTLGNVVSGTTCNVTLGNNSITYVGNKTVTTTLSNSNYKLPSTSTKQISVTKRTPSVTVTGVSQTYNNTDYYAKVTKTDAKGTLYWKYGSAPTQSSYDGTTDVSSASTPVGNPAALSTAINVTSVKNVTNQTLYWIFVPSSSATITTGQTYAANFNESASGSVTMKITAAAITIPTISAVEVTYDKAAHSLTFPAVTGASITKYQTSTDGSTWTDASPSTTNPSLTNKGTLYVRAYYTADSNHSGSGYTTGKTIKINEKGVTLTWGSPTTWTYNGSAHSITGSSISGVINGDSCTLSLANNSITYVGSQTVTASLDNSNYTISSGGTTKSISVTKATPTISVTGVNKTYNNVDYYAVLTGSNVKGTVYWKKGSAPTTSSGGYDGSASITSTGNSLSINLGSIKLDADDHTLYWLVVPSSATITTGHTYAENYNNASGTTEMTINPKAISIGTPTNGSGVYNGSAYTASFPAVTGAQITNYRWSTTNGSGWTESSTNPGLTNAGTIYVQAYYTAQSNYTGSNWSASATITVSQRPVTITAASASKTYDGDALSSNSASASTQNNTDNTGMLSTHHLHSYTVSGSQTIAGNGTNTVSNAKIYTGTTHGGSGDTTDVTSNYNITYAPGTLTVNKRSVTYKAINQSKVYDGSVLTATNTAERTGGSNMTDGSLGSHTVTFTCSGEIGPGVTTGTKTLSSVVIKNGGGTDVSDSFNITKQNGTLKITNATITYSANSPVSTYCTSAATATDVTDSNREIVISSTSATDYSGAAITNGSNPATQGYTISQSGWSVSSDGKKIIVPADVTAGTYNNVKITVAKPNHTSKEVTINVTITATVLTGIVLTLKKTSIAYQATTEVDTLIATYNNGATKDVKDDANTTYTQSASPAVVQFL